MITTLATLIAIPTLITYIRKSNSKYVIRAAFDVGSGATKMCVAVVERCVERGQMRSYVRKILYDDQTSVLLRCDMSISEDGKTLSDSILKKAEKTLQDYLNIAVETYGCDSFGGIATAVFRKAKNGETFLKSRILKNLGLEIKLVDQKTEGRIGWQSASNAFSTINQDASIDANDIVSWDSGGGSFQIANRRGDVYGEHQGSATATAIMLEIQGRKLTTTTNPVKEVDVRDTIRVLTDKISTKPPSWINSESIVVAIGGRTCAFRICMLACGTNTYGPEDLMSALKRLLGKTDEDLKGMGFPEVQMAIPKLCLIYTVMKKCNITKIVYIRTNGSTLGVLVEESLW